MIGEIKTWIVNDKLTCIPGTKTFWHMLLEIEGAIDKTSEPFIKLASIVENDPEHCDIIIRNATFFRRINRDCKQIAFLQDAYKDDVGQIDVCVNSSHVVFNSPFTQNKYAAILDQLNSYSVIPIGVNENIFYPSSIFKNKRFTLCFVGDYNSTKNTRMLERIAKSRSDLDFIYISKLGSRINSPNVLNVTGGVNENEMASLYNRSDACIMCSELETLHLTTVEAALCNKPVIGTRTGWLASHFSNKCGILVDEFNNLDEYVAAIDFVKDNYEFFSPREHILTTPYVWSNCKASWEKLIKEVYCG